MTSNSNNEIKHNLNNLPIEIKEMIIYHLPSSALVRLAMTNSNIEKLISSSLINDKFNDEIDYLEKISSDVKGQFDIIEKNGSLEAKIIDIEDLREMDQIVYPHLFMDIMITVGSDDLFGSSIFSSKKRYLADTKYGFTLSKILDSVADLITLPISMGENIQDRSRFGGLKWYGSGFDVILR